MSSCTELITSYYAAFNRAAWSDMLALVSEGVEHDINQGKREVGRAAFAKFLEHMDRCYRERVVELVVCENADGSRCAAEFQVEGVYLQTDPGFPEARKQRYRLPAGAFFELRNGKIQRVTTYYNVREWLAQIA